jgi:hypothetical protein
MRRQKTVQLEKIAFTVGKRRAFVEQRIIEQFVTAQGRFDEIRLVSSHRAGPAISQQRILPNGPRT